MRTTRSDEEFMHQLSDLLLAEGTSALGIGDIATRVRCSRRRIYQVAPNKEALLQIVARRHLEAGLRAGFEAAARETAPARVISAYLTAGVATAEKMSTDFLKDLEAAHEGREIFDHYLAERARGLREIMERGVRQGHYNPHNPLVAAELILGAAMRLRQSRFLVEAELTFTEAVEQAYALILHGLIAPTRASDTVVKAGARRGAARAA